MSNVVVREATSVLFCESQLRIFKYNTAAFLERTAVESQFKQFEFEDVWLASEVEPLQDNFDILGKVYFVA